MGQPRPALQPPIRRGESRAVRFIQQWWAPITQCLLSTLLAAGLVFGVDTALFDPGTRHSYWDIIKEGSLRPSDITTLVSVWLVAARLAGQSLAALVAWRCVMILLQNDGLNLSQIDRMISYRLPSAWSGKHAWIIVLVLLMMHPSGFVAPLLSGSIDWELVIKYEDTNPVDGGFKAPNDPPRAWAAVSYEPVESLLTLVQALGRASAAWLDGASAQNLTSLDTHRYVSLSQASVGVVVKDVPIPVLEVHSISWSDPLEDWVNQIVLEQTRILYTPGGDKRNQSYTIGNAILFQKETTPPTTPEPTEIAATTRKIAVLVARDYNVINNLGPSPPTQAYCSPEKLKTWWDTSNWAVIPGLSGNCWAVGNINFTAGIRYFDTGRYITNQSIEAVRNVKVMEELVGDKWREPAIYMLSDIMSTLPSMGAVRKPGGNLTQYAGELVQRSYTAMRTVMFPFAPDSELPKLKAQRPVSYLQANVNSIRVLIWLILNLLLPVSVLIVSWVEEHSDMECRRNTLAETSLGPLLTDVREVLAGEENGITNLSYVTAADSKDMGILQLNAIEGPSGNSIFALTKPTPKAAATKSWEHQYMVVGGEDHWGT